MAKVKWLWRACILILLLMVSDRLILWLAESQPCLVYKYYEHLQAGDRMSVMLCDIRGSYLQIYFSIFGIAVLSSIALLFISKVTMPLGSLALLWAFILLIFFFKAFFIFLRAPIN